ncbi:helix-turn-helix domain containing protein [Bacillus cereus]|nr:helix-turn-helix domain containing protein [Bacillus cereus]MDA2130391.1 helix-turn-helix domain containing protein [Bacillus cereus]MDA2152773.1 helix-turn-helix domain containing protein [Bacillus cereus]MDA2525633.1 helix-turn-helix domain containing protein [Bacillus cereus]MDA2537164.1 helix-turn-helix domain containing protein [Bacillus cereus]
MDKFITHLIQDKSIIRQLQILETLIDSNEIKSSKDLSQILECTSRTIINDISQLKLALPENWDLISIQSKGYLLKRDFSNDFSELVIPYIMNSELYKILMGIFNQKYYSLEKWSQLLYLDKITLKKLLKNFRKTLEIFGLDLNFRTIKLVGQEINLRYFYIMFFYNIQKYQEMITLDSRLQEKIKNITRNYNVEIDYNMLTIIISVSIKRVANKHFISEIVEFQPILNTNNLECINSIICELENFFNIKFTEYELSYFKNAFSIILEWNTEEKKRITDYYYKTSKKTYDKNIHLFQKISSEINVCLKIKEKIKHDLFFRLHKIYKFQKYGLSIGAFGNEFDIVHQEFSEGHNIIYPLISSWNKKINKNRLNNDEVNYIIYHILFIVHSNHNKKGLLLLSGSSALKKFIYYKLNHELGDFVTLQQRPDCIHKFDFILTNYQIQNTPIPIIRISNKTIQKDSSYVRKILSPFN